MGKIAIPDAILLKPGPLTEQETTIMRRHPRIGHELLSGSQSRFIQTGATVALRHHERYDGTGYPDGLVGEAIPLEARIVAVADVFDALTSDRVYRRALPVDEAMRVMALGRGTQFDSDVLDAFERSLSEILEIRAQTVTDRELLAA